MKIVLDTNVFISGIFYRGAPHRILRAWRDRRLTIVFSPAILDEYRRVGDRLARQFPGVDVSPFLSLLLTNGRTYSPPALPEQVCTDPEDDKFLACALAARCKTIISGDRHLVAISGYRGIKVWRPRAFVDRFLGQGG
ncbi:MAG: putative toxin-antitoxin system toxin component, PIN family [Candidatus Eisenbacteria bacterium]|nr:putative toxin-antitoxin system toxin component, PIN family [Candidatus Eisenbacteria bacterium]